MWSRLTACFHLLTSRALLPPCCRSLVRLPPPATTPPQLSTWRLLSSLPSLSLAHFLFIAHVSFLCSLSLARSSLSLARPSPSLTWSSPSLAVRGAGVTMSPGWVPSSPPLGQGSHPCCLPLPAAVLPPVAGACLHRGAGPLLWRGDRLSPGVPALAGRGVPRHQGEQAMPGPPSHLQSFPSMEGLSCPSWS